MLRNSAGLCAAQLKPNSITLSGLRQVHSWSQTCSELEFGLSSSSLAATCRDSSNLVAVRFEAEFHYAILVADRSEAGRRPASLCYLAASELDDILNSSSQLGLRPASDLSATR